MAHHASMYEVAIAELVAYYQADHSLTSMAGGHGLSDSDFQNQIERRAEILEEILAEEGAAALGNISSRSVN